jgi:hypothetical protein
MARRVLDRRWVGAAIVLGGLIGVWTSFGVPRVQPPVLEVPPAPVVEPAAAVEPSTTVETPFAANLGR